MLIKSMAIEDLVGGKEYCIYREATCHNITVRNTDSGIRLFGFKT